MRAISWIGLGAVMVLGLTAGGAWAQSGYALEFDGIDDRVIVSDPVNVTGPLTLEVWIRPDVFDGGRILSNRHASDGYEMDIDTSGGLRFTIDGCVRGSVNITSHLGQWVHVAVTWEGPSGGDVLMYVNGDVEATDTFTGTMTDATGNLQIGFVDWYSYTFNGAIDEPRIFDTVVDGETIQIWMTRRIDPGHPDYANLQGAWSFEDGSGQVATCEIPGLDGQLGYEAVADDGDPMWGDSGMVATTRWS